MLVLFLVILAFLGIVQEVGAQTDEEEVRIYINEFLPNPDGDDNKLEFIELYNDSDTAQDISSWKLQNASGQMFAIPEHTIVGERNYLVFYSEETKSLLANTGDRSIRLLDAGDTLREEVAYSGSKEAYSYSRTEDGQYEQSSLLTPNAANQFLPSPSPTITPTPSPTASPVPVYSDKIFINEFLPNPKGGDGTGEFIELMNLGSESVDISEWVLDDVVDAGSTPFSIPDETVISGNGFMVFYRPLTKISLNNDSDHVRLIRPDAVMQDDVSYSGTSEAHSYNRTDAEKYEKSSTLTPGAANNITKISTPTPKPAKDDDKEKDSEFSYNYSEKIFINEFLPNPKRDDTEQEFIEIKSEDKRNINLFGYLLDDGDGGSAPFKFGKEDSIISGKIIALFRKKTKISLNNDADQVRLIDPMGKVISVVAYSAKIVEGQSYNRNTEGEFEWSDVTTPGKENTISIQEKIASTPKPKAAKKTSRSTVSRASRVLSATVPVVSMLPWPRISQDTGFVSRSVATLGNSANDVTPRQEIFILFGLSMAGMQLLGGISHRERIWQK